MFLDPQNQKKTCFLEGFWKNPPVYLGPGLLKNSKEGLGLMKNYTEETLNVSIHVTVIRFSTPCSRPRYTVRCHWIIGDGEKSCVQWLHVMSKRTSPGGDSSSPKNSRTNSTLRVPPATTSKAAVLLHDLTVFHMTSRETVLVFVRQTIREQLLPSDDLCHAVQILGAVGIWTKAQEIRKQGLARIAAVWVGVKLRGLCAAQTFEGGLGPPPPFCVN